MKAIERRVERLESTLPPADGEGPEIIYVAGATRGPDGEIGGEIRFAMLVGGDNVSRDEGETEDDFKRRVEAIHQQRKANPAQAAQTRRSNTYA